jgi:hypothetical protein
LHRANGMHVESSVRVAAHVRAPLCRGCSTSEDSSEIHSSALSGHWYQELAGLSLATFTLVFVKSIDVT